MNDCGNRQIKLPVNALDWIIILKVMFNFCSSLT
jgi:hypothetical protein